MLLDMLGVMIGFSAIMLLLSLLVMSFVQAIMALFRFRGRNLLGGLTDFLEAQDVVQGDRKGLKAASHKLINHRIGIVADKQAMFRPFLGPTASRVDKDKVLGFVIAEKNIKNQSYDPASLEQDFSRLEDRLSVRFAKRSRMLSVVGAFFIAVVFQVSTPDLLRELSTNAEMREAVLTNVDLIATDAGEIITNPVEAQDVAEQALDQLIKGNRKFRDSEELKNRLEEASGQGEDIDALVAELATIFPENPDQVAKWQSQYRELIDKLVKEERAKVKDQAKKVIAHLATVKIEPWKEGWKFYNPPSWNWLGVLMTIILLTLGAPFWYEMLRNLARLRDMLSPDTGGKGSSNKIAPPATRGGVAAPGGGPILPLQGNTMGITMAQTKPVEVLFKVTPSDGGIPSM